MTNCYRREFVVKDRAEAVQAWLCGDEEAMAQAASEMVRESS